MDHEDQKPHSLCILSRLLVVLINLFYQLNFLFLLKGKDLFCVVFVLIFCWVLFFTQCEYGIGLNVDVPSKSTS